MKQGLFFTFAILLIFGALGVWIYLLIFGTPLEGDAMFADLGFGEEDLPRAELPIGESTTLDTTVDLSTSLSQITARPVAGYVLIASTASTSPRIRYAERGIGHVYELDLQTGLETRVLGKTFTGITDAVLAPDGNIIVLIAESGSMRTVYLESIEDTGVTHDLPADAENISFATPTVLRYTLTGSEHMSGFTYDLSSGEATQRFSVPFTQARVIWNDAGIWIYNKPAPHLTGGLYRFTDASLIKIGRTEYGLSALMDLNGDTTIFTYADPKLDVLGSMASTGGTETLLPITAIPEKCVFEQNVVDPILWCGAPINQPERTFQSQWYQGAISTNDVLWRIDINTSTADAAINFRAETGRTIDVIDLSIDTSGTRILFRNKIDGTLWHYRIEDDADMTEVADDGASAETETTNEGI